MFVFAQRQRKDARKVVIYHYIKDWINDKRMSLISQVNRGHYLQDVSKSKLSSTMALERV